MRNAEAAVLVEQIWTANSYRNFNYLVACPETGEALAIDPLDHRKCLALARERGWDIRQVLNTHEHGDHIGGNGPVIAATGAKLLAHHAAGARIPGMDRGLSAGDLVKVGRSVELQVLDTPGHATRWTGVVEPGLENRVTAWPRSARPRASMSTMRSMPP